MAAEREKSPEQRRSERAHWPIRRLRLQDDASDDLSEVTTPEERIAMMWTLAESAWRLAGLEIPTYERRDTPTRLYRPGTRPPDDDA